jgi:predicted small secreted protein
MSKVLVLIFTILALSACNTVRGVGKDIQKGGEAIENSTK